MGWWWWWGGGWGKVSQNAAVLVVLVDNWILRNKLRWNLDQNTKLFIHKNASENIVCETAAIFSRGRWVKQRILLTKKGSLICKISFHKFWHMTWTYIIFFFMKYHQWERVIIHILINSFKHVNKAYKSCCMICWYQKRKILLVLSNRILKNRPNHGINDEFHIINAMHSNVTHDIIFIREVHSPANILLILKWPPSLSHTRVNSL